MIEIINGDSRDVLKSFQESSFDCCIADPPYGDTSLSWDSAARGWVADVARVLKPSGALWVFGSLRYLVSLYPEMEAAGFKYSQDIVWEKQNGTGFHADRFRRVHEHAVLFYRGLWRDVYRDVQTTPDATAKTVRRKKRPPHTGSIDGAHYVSHDGGPRLARSVLRVRNEHGRALHPTQKPEGIIEPLLLYSTPPGGTVLDPFFGAGTTGLVAREHGRRCVGIELNEEYVAIARRRLGMSVMTIDNCREGIFA